MGAKCSRKKQSSYPVEFSKQVQQLQTIREGTLEIVHQLEKINSVAKPNSEKKKKGKKQQQGQMSVIDQLANTCIKYNSVFAGHKYGEQMMRLSTAFKKLSKSSMDTQEEVEKQCIAPMRQWAGEGFETLMKELVKCQKLKDDLKRAEKLAAKTSDTPTKDKLQQLKKAYDSQRAYCTKEFEATQKHFTNQMQYIRTMIELQYKQSTSARLTLDAALMKNVTVTSILKANG